MFFDDSAQALARDVPAVGLFRGAENAADQEAVPSARLARKAAEINASTFKRLLDVVGAAGLLLVLAPVLILIAIAVKLESKGPVLFRQKRYGVGREIFTLMKFRSMTVMETHGAFKQVSAGDNRITRVGAFLRRTSLDELPQLFNVVRGEMSLVGPRPPLPEEVERYSGYELLRLQVKPGCTGLWQVSGRNRLHFTEMVEMDLDYIERRSVWLDIKLIARTVVVMFKAKDAY